jgi:predicted PurR-regulated permease PerM
VRTIAVTIGLVLATVIALWLVQQVARTLIWIMIALFFAVAAYPAVGRLERRLHVKRSLATLVVFLGAFLVLVGLFAAFITPLARQADDLAAAVPTWAADIRAGRGPLGIWRSASTSTGTYGTTRRCFAPASADWARRLRTFSR